MALEVNSSKLCANLPILPSEYIETQGPRLTVLVHNTKQVTILWPSLFNLSGHM